MKMENTGNPQRAEICESSPFASIYGCQDTYFIFVYLLASVFKFMCGLSLY